MRTVEFLGIHVDVCEDTGGVWFDSGELAAVRRADATAYRRLEEVPTTKVARAAVTVPVVRVCPHDGAALERYRYQYSSPIELDQCARCGGIWVDDGELAMMADFLADDAEPSAKVMAQAEAAGLLGKLEMDHQAKLGRLRALNGVVSFLQRPMSPWWGF